MRKLRCFIVSGLVTAGVLMGGASTWAVTTIGSLSNFDAVNDTGGETEGFEIELEDVHSSDIYGTFGAPYNRYGNPVTEDTATGVIVRWAAKWDPTTMAYDTATPLAAAGINPGGHDCFDGGSIGNYAGSGCEHFGISLGKSQTSTAYRWLVADPNAPGNLISGPNVSIPAPIFSLPAVQQPGNPPAIVQAAFEAPREPGDAREYGDAFWAKVIKTQVHSQKDLVLNDLVFNGSNDPNGMGLFMEDDQNEPAEIEWTIIQNQLAGGEVENERGDDLLVDAGDMGVAYRYEFYDYTGAFDPESNEALPINDGSPDPADLGGYLGAQMAGVNLNNIPVPEPTSMALLAVGCLLLARRRGRHSF